MRKLIEKAEAEKNKDETEISFGSTTNDKFSSVLAHDLIELDNQKIKPKRSFGFKSIYSPLLLGMTIMFASGIIAYQYAANEIELDFEKKANERIGFANNQIQKYESLLSAISNMIIKDEEISQKNFYNIAKGMINSNQYPELEALSYLTLENPKELNTFYPQLKKSYQEFLSYSTLPDNLKIKVLDVLKHNEMIQRNKIDLDTKNKSDKKIILLNYSYPITQNLLKIGSSIDGLTLNDVVTAKKEIYSNGTTKLNGSADADNIYDYSTNMFKNIKVGDETGIVSSRIRIAPILFNNVSAKDNDKMSVKLISPMSDGMRVVFHNKVNLNEVNRYGGKALEKIEPIKIGKEYYQLKINTYRDVFNSDIFFTLWKNFMVYGLLLCVLIFAIFRKKLSKPKDLLENTQKIESMAQQLRMDELTHLLNRRAFVSDMEYLLEASKKNKKSQKVTIIFIDLDGFKRINDTMGHSYGDYVLVEYSKRLRGLLSDIASATIYRLGGDEFTVILNNQPFEEVELVVNNILEISKEGYFLKEETFNITQSIGVSSFPENAWTSEALLRNADMAMYEAKKKGKNCFVFFNSKISEEVEKRNKIVNNLTHAIEKDEFYMVYQPKFKETQENTFVFSGVEALIRWNNDKLGHVPPDVFIGIAEETGLIREMGYWIIESICKDFDKIRKKVGREFKVAINVSAKQIGNEILPYEFLRVLKNYSIDPKNFIVEITETTMMKQPELSKKSLNIFKELGFSISVDDFGTGYSSLSYLRQFPVDELKIDKSFTDLILNDHHTQVIVSGIVNMSQKLSMNIVIEGVESFEQIGWIKEECKAKGINNIEYQGYYFNKPMKREDLMELLTNNTERKCNANNDGKNCD